MKREGFLIMMMSGMMIVAIVLAVMIWQDVRRQNFQDYKQQLEAENKLEELRERQRQAELEHEWAKSDERAIQQLIDQGFHPTTARGIVEQKRQAWKEKQKKEQTGKFR